VRREECTVFTIVRNPFDLLVSMYTFGFPYWPPRYASQRGQIEWPFRSFRDFVYKLCKWDDYPWICPAQKKSLFFQLFDDEGNALPDHVIRQESLSQGLTRLLEIIGTPAEVPERRVNVSRQAEAVRYQDFYDDELKQLVERHFGGDLSVFGYAFEGHDGRALLALDGVRYDHAAGCYRDMAAPYPCSKSTMPLTGALADIDMHGIGAQVLDCFTGRQLAHELLRRLSRRFTMSMRG
jgi:hypothetical protein